MTRRLVLVLVLGLVPVLAGCPKEDPPKPDASAPPASSSISPQASAAPAADASAAGAGAVAAASYDGKYTATPGTLHIPSDNKDYTGVKQSKDEGTKMVGDGTMTLSVDGSGRVTGTFESGPAQGSVVDGTIADGNVSGTVRVKDPGADGLHGSLVGKMAGDSIEGTMKLADSNASVLRDVKFTAKKK
jgi:hypothetical protein